MPPHRAHHAEGDMTSAFRSDLLEKRKNRMADRIGASVTNRFMKRGLILPGCTCVGKQEEIEERDNTRLSNSPRSTLFIFLSFFFFSHTLPSVLHWLVPRRAKMGRDDKRRAELVGWWVASPSPSCSNLVLLTFILISPHLLPSSSSFFFYTYSYCVSRLSLLFLLRLVFHLLLLGPVRWGAFQRGAGKDGGEEASVRGLAVDWFILTCYNISQSPALFLIVCLSSGFSRLCLTPFWSCSPDKQ